MSPRIFFKLLAAFVLVIAAAMVTMSLTIGRAWQDSLLAETERSLTEKTRLFAQGVENDHNHTPQQLAVAEAQAAGARATIIDRQGKVLGESEVDPQTMENHATRPEFVSALQGRVGTSTRESHTVGVPYLYVAVPTSAGAVRMAYPLSSIQEARRQIQHKLLQASALAFALALLLAGLAASSLSRRLRKIQRFSAEIASGNLSARIQERGSDEIGELAATLDKTARQVEESFNAVQTSRKELETLLNSMQEIVIAISREGRVRWANVRSARITPSVRLQAPIAETIRDPDFLRAVGEVLKTQSIQVVRMSSALSGRAYSAMVAPMPDGGAVAVLNDLTAVERAEKTRRDFIANVSHELRTPLTSIQGYAETLLESADSEPSREFLEIIRKNAARMSRLTEDLLTLARVESREHRFEFRNVEPAALLRDAVQSFQEIARSAGINLQVQNGVQQLVRADVDAIHQVFANLIDNAIKYGASGGRVVVGARPCEDGSMVEFFVRDFGLGIASEHLSRIFERFYRVDKARSRESGGTGLGLAIAKHIVLAHGGEIRALSELNHGATFAFTLPAQAVVEPQNA